MHIQYYINTQQNFDFKFVSKNKTKILKTHFAEIKFRGWKILFAEETKNREIFFH